ncbi:MAG TPA: hypothetical protein VKX49_05860 [Bryobacteraceae bacterium]|nr:hypothetical protein [Bryobacteraceae bacterium]
MKHWTENDFQNWLYGLKEPDTHSNECADCRSEMERLQNQRRAAMRQPEVSPEFLAAQRRNIYARLQRAPRLNWTAWRWVLSTAMLLALAFALAIPRWLHKPAPPVSDEQLFSDLAAMEQTAEPKAIQPMHNLFEP